MYICVLPTPSPHSRGSKVNFKPITFCLNSEFSSPRLVDAPRLKKLSL